MGGLRLRLLGNFRVWREPEGEVPIRSKKGQALLAFLALEGARRHSREKLATLLWGDRPEEQARHSLRQSVLSLRKTLGNGEPPALLADGDTLALNPDAIEVDVRAFERLAAQDGPQILERAMALYTGDLLDGLNPRAEAFEAWRAGEATRLRSLACDVLCRLAARYAQNGDTERAIEATQRLLALDPVREDGHRMLMRLYERSGQRARALKQYRICADALLRELDAEPALETTRVYSEIRTQRPAAKVAAATEAAAAPQPDPRAQALPLPDKPSIAVLPFDNLSGDPEQEYFAEGIAEDIITALSRFRMFFVIARHSSFAYKGGAVEVKQVARELGVRYVLQGSVRKADTRLRITTQFVDTVDDHTVWAERYDREIEDIFAVQDEITQNIILSVFPEFMSAEIQRAQRKDARNLDAWDYVLRAHWHFSRFTKEDNAEAQRLLHKVIELDPSSALGWSDLAFSRLLDAYLAWHDAPALCVMDAAQAAQKAVAIDERDAVAYIALGTVDLYSRRHDDAIAKLERAIELNPNLWAAHGVLGMVLAFAGQSEAAVERVQEAFRLCPYSPLDMIWYANLSVAALVAGDLETAAGWARRSVQESPEFPGGHRLLAASSAQLGRLEEARGALEAALSLVPEATISGLRIQVPFKDPADLERYLDGLRKAGLPE
jgi:TolB-like protein/Flp pilus assembly protein TadD